MAQLAAIPKDEGEPEPHAPAPQVFVRTFVTPAGMPWDQSRGAALEARLGAPLPINDLHYRLKRLTRWSLGQAGRYAVFYVRRRDLTGPFETTMDIDGHAVRVSFGGRARPTRSMPRVGLLVVAIGVTAAMAVGLAATALSIRATQTQQLDELERQTAMKLRLGRKVQHEATQTHALRANQGRSGQASDVLADLAWIAHARTADARILSVHWDHGLIAIEARGTEAPVEASGRQILRAPKPGRTGTWLWGVSRSVSILPADSTSLQGPRSGVGG
jgi:hypothetical protein